MDKNLKLAYLLVPISFLYYYVGINSGLNIYDEGLTVYGAARILNGEIPYRDFWTYYSPGIFYLYAGAFKAFGLSLAVERTVNCLFLSLLPLVAYLITARFAPRRYALLAWFLMLIENIYWTYGSSGAVSLCLCLISMYIFIKYLADHKQKRVLFAGIAVGFAALFRYDYAAYVLSAEMAVVIFFALRDSAVGERLSRLGATSSSLLGGFLLVLFPVVVFFWFAVPKSELYAEFVSFPFKIYPQVRSLPYPSLFVAIDGISLSAIVDFGRSMNHSFLYYFPITVFVFAATVLLRHAFWKIDLLPRDSFRGVFFILITGVLFLNIGRIRSDMLHALPAFACATILASVFFSLMPSRHMQVGILAVFLIIGIVPIGQRIKTVRESLILSRTHSFTLERSKGIYCKYKAYEDAVRYIQEKVPPQERIFVGNYRHDRVFANDAIFYFLADRHSATRYHDLHPGVADTPEVQKCIVADLEASGVNYIVLRDWRISEPNKSSLSSGAQFLDDYIKDNFVLDRPFEGYHIWRRKLIGSISLPQPDAQDDKEEKAEDSSPWSLSLCSEWFLNGFPTDCSLQFPILTSAELAS